jgi:hypothetical protein
MRSLSTSFIVIAALLLSACSDAGDRGPKAAKQFAEFDTLTVDQSPCLFECPVFEVKIFGDGRVIHSGPTFEQSGGAHESRIDRRGLEQIAKALRDARIDEMRDHNGTEADGCMTDMSTISFDVSRSRGYRSKKVVFDSGCVGPNMPTARINLLIKAIDQVTGTTQLLEERKKVRPPGVLSKQT